MMRKINHWNNFPKGTVDSPALYIKIECLSKDML